MSNASRNPAEDVTKTATQTADHIEQSVRSGDKEAYKRAMSEVNTFRDTHTPDDTKTYTSAVTKKLEDDKVLPTVSLFEAQTNFSRIDTSGNGRLETGELDLYKNRRDVNEVQAAFISNIQKNYDTIRNYSQWGETWYGGNSDAIADQDIDDGFEQQRAIMNLHAPGKDGVSLFDKLNKDGDGNIVGGTFDAALAGDNAVARTLTPEDRQTILTLQKNQPTFSFNDFNKDSLDQFTRDSGLDPNAVQNQKRSARVETPVPIENLPPRQEQMQSDYQREQQQAQAKEKEAAAQREAADARSIEAEQRVARDTARNPHAMDRGRHLPNPERYNRPEDRNVGAPTQDHYYDFLRQRHNDEKIADALTVRKGESYAHSAERLLSLAGNTDPSGKELKEVAHQLWVADQKRKSGGLKVGQTLNLDANLRRNQALAKLFDGSDL